MASPILIGSNISLHPSVQWGEHCVVGHCSIVGYPPDNHIEPSAYQSTRIKSNVKIGAFAVLELGTLVDEGVFIDHYVRVGCGSSIGADSYLLYGTRIHRNVTIGKRCRISGNCPDGTIIGDDVTHFCRIHHKYNQPRSEWTTTDEPSPVIGSGTVIGAGAILVGGIVIGEQCYIAAGEVLREPLKSRTIFYKGKSIPAADWKGSLSMNFYGDVDNVQSS